MPVETGRLLTMLEQYIDLVQGKKYAAINEFAARSGLVEPIVKMSCAPVLTFEPPGPDTD